MTTDIAISIEALVKKFGKFTALNELNLQINTGEVHGFLGPNGSGKSTTIRVLLGLLKADAGKVSVFGKDPWRDVVDLHKRLAYVPGDVSLWPNLSGGEAIDLLGNLRGGLDSRRREELIERFELDPSKRGRQYSKGNRQKVAIIAALAANADLLILDEPTSGLDPLMEAIFQDEIAKEKNAGKTVLLSSHILSEVEALADRVSIIRCGEIIQSGTLDEMRGQARVNIAGTLSVLPAALSESPLFHSVHIASRQHFSAQVEAHNVNTALAELLHFGVANLTVTPASLEELFLTQYDEQPQQQPAEYSSRTANEQAK
ncbi:ABC-2 type transport system ATP-binding protein [Arcanobacterium pluranimalium]|uniref:ABC transporter ATP-binding protein n=1 Tax=Arcanobacterium pluranimalium TaxID=108028 RepID=UPI001957CD5C|nr:ABC transporter ATP-binding protein [Arcanobacterium pluranimalium]MBM7824744.1 ABC-2 type transport system ATP-binding protein [Arcanobacterium pluranimalium]